MKKTVFLVFVLILIVSCNKRKVHLPKTSLNSVEEMKNYSAIWIFDDNGKADLNQNNRISSTHWLFHIDKTLQLNEVIPILKKLLIKHNKKSPHKVEGMKNYITYVNSLNNKLNFYSFDSINYNIVSNNDLLKFNSKKDTVLIVSENELLKINKNKKNILAYSGDFTLQQYMLIKAKTDSIKKFISKTELIIKD